MPNVIGLSLQSAQATLPTQADFYCATGQDFIAEGGPATVRSQNPGPGTLVPLKPAKGAILGLSCQMPAASTRTLPNVVGEQEAGAGTQLSALNLEVAPQCRPVQAGQSANEVTGQSPAPGSMVPAYSIVVLDYAGSPCPP